MLQRFKLQWPRRGGLRRAPHVQAVAVHNEHIWPNLAVPQAQSQVYAQSPWVYVAVNRIAEAAALVPLRVVPLNEADPAPARHPLVDLLDAPNPYLSRFELIEQTVGALELTGSAYWFLAGDASGTPREIWPLRPDRVAIVPDRERYVRGYLYELDGQRIPLDAVEVIHFRRWNPASDYEGLSALEAARVAIQSDRAMAEWNRSTFGHDHGVPAGIVNIRDYVSDADFERIKREWRQSYGGGQRRTAFLRGGAVEWQHIGLSHQDLDFLRGRQQHRDEILNLFGVPIGILSENATEANATVAERLFIERTLWPKLVRLAQKITQELLPFWPGRYRAEFEDIRPTDARARLEEIRTAYPLLSINELRARYYNLPPVGWGDMPATGPADSAAATTGLCPSPAGEGQLSAAKRGEVEHHESATATKKYATTATATNAGLDDAAAEEEGAPAGDPHDELRRWERFAVRRLRRAGQGRAFEVRALPDDLAFEISARLVAARTADAVRAVFADARATLAAPPAEVEEEGEPSAWRQREGRRAAGSADKNRGARIERPDDEP